MEDYFPIFYFSDPETKTHFEVEKLPLTQKGNMLKTGDFIFYMQTEDDYAKVALSLERALFLAKLINAYFIFPEKYRKVNFHLENGSRLTAVIDNELTLIYTSKERTITITLSPVLAVWLASVLELEAKEEYLLLKDTRNEAYNMLKMRMQKDELGERDYG